MTESGHEARIKKLEENAHLAGRVAALESTLAGELAVLELPKRIMALEAALRETLKPS